MNRIRYKKPNVRLSAWQIWLAYVRYEGSSEGKKRPVLVTEVRGDTCTVAEITSQPPAHATDVPILYMYHTGLNKDSVVQTRKRRTVPRDSLRDYMGYLTGEDIQRVRNFMEARR